MFAVIFEVQPKRERLDDYLAFATSLRPAAEASDGFIDVERYQSGRADGRLLSLSFWRDEAAVTQWRSHPEHRRIQAKCRTQIFADYRLRVGAVIEDGEAPVAPARDIAAAAKPQTRAISITEVWPDDHLPATPLSELLALDGKLDGLAAQESFASLYTPGKRLLLLAWQSVDAAARWTPARQNPRARLRHRRVLVLRDYGMRDRAEAPQAAPETQAASVTGD